MSYFERYVMEYLHSNMYVCVESRGALLIDPHISETVLHLLKNGKVENIHVLLTHEHFDHTTGVNWYRQYFPMTVVCQRNCADSIRIEKNNCPFVFFPMNEEKTEQEKEKILAFYDSLPTDSIFASIVFDDRHEFFWEGHEITIIAAPGHSMGSSVILFDDTYVFTGDYMIPDTPVILRLPGGSKELYRQQTLPYLLQFGSDCWIMPGHGELYLRGQLSYINGRFVKISNGKGDTGK